jgi:3-oxoacyl-(acyl-carrier-protein) synthase
MSKKVLITGLGIISSVGRNTQENLESLLNGKSGVGKMKYLNSFYKDVIPVSEIKFTDEELAEMSGLKEKPVTRTTLIAMIAAREAVESAKLSQLSKLRTGVISGNSVGGMGLTENHYMEYLKDTCEEEIRKGIDLHDCAESTQVIADQLGFTDFISTISTACSSAANAIMLGARLIKTNKLDRVIVGGVDALTKFTLNGFNTLMILDRAHCKPFDQNRMGLNLGEGAGFIVIESEEAAKEGNREILGQVTGYANTNDAYHQTASSPEGDGAFMAMKKALEVAGLTPSEIDYVNVHGTGTANNDLSEGRAMERLFEGKVPPFSSTKAFTGHTLGAAGGIEAVYSVLAIRNKVIFPNLNFTDQMSELSISPVITLRKDVNIRHVLSNSFGFGGNNASLVFSAN